MKLLFTSDLHGDLHLYQELSSLALSASADIIALGGDLLPSFAPSRRYEEMIPYQKDFIRQFLLSSLKKILETTRVRNIFLIPGNWDLGYPFLFKEPIEGLVDLHQKRYSFENGYELIGYPFVPPTPFRPKEYEKMDDEESPWPPQKNPSYICSTERPDQVMPVDSSSYLRGRETIKTDLARLPKVQDQKKTIYVMHSPPFGTRLDLIQGGSYAGSRSIRAFIEKEQPLVTLHGHIHESPEISGSYFEWIGETICINPGQSAWAGKHPIKLDAVLFEIENPKHTLTHTGLSG
jgi:Icc-related predicted phosphoesterase